jgi:DNA-binding PadR family transcriptional regulator
MKMFKHYRMKMRGEGKSDGFGFGGFGHHGEARGGRRGSRGAEGHAGERGHAGRRRRLFDSAELRLMILSLLESQPRHGYDVIRALEAASGGTYTPSPGMVYPLLNMLTDQELVHDASDSGARKIFSLASSGLAEIEGNRDAIAALLERLKALSDVAEKTDAIPVRRAMHNLRSVLMARLSDNNVTRETILDAVSLIDEAAQKIERL